MRDYQDRPKEAASRGYAVNDGETSLEETGLAASVYDHRGEVVAAVLIPDPRFRVAPETLVSLGKSCAATASGITARLGGHRQDTELTA